MNVSAWWRDARFALGVFRRQSRLSAAAAICIALGIAATTAVVTLVDLTTFEPVPFRNADRLVRIWNEIEADGTRADLSWGGYEDVAGLQSLEHLEATARARLIYITDAGSRRVDGEAISPGYFELLGIEAFAGRTFTADEYQDGSEPVIMISHAAWGAMFDFDPEVVGATLRTNTQSYNNPRQFTIVGIMPPSFVGTTEADFPDIEFWMPAYQYVWPALREARGARLVQTVGTLRQGTTLEQTAEELGPLSEELRTRYPQARRDVVHRVEFFGTNWREAFQRGNPMLLGAAGLLLVVAVANVAGLLLARTEDRRHEIAVRTALGASRGEIVRQLLFETLVITTVGGAAGLLAAPFLLRFFVAASAADIPSYVDVAPDAGVMSVCAAILAVAALATGVVPATMGSRRSAARTLHEGGTRASGSRRDRWVGGGIVVAEIALTVVLVITSGLLLRSYWQLESADLGFRTERFLRMGLFVDVAEIAGPEGLPAFYDRLRESILEDPEVERVALVNPTVPLEDPTRVRVSSPRMSADLQETGIDTMIYSVGPDFFETLEISVLAGRGFARDDDREATPVAIVSRSLAKTLGGVDSAVGTTMRWGRREVQIVGVVENAAMGGPNADQRYDRQLYQSIYQTRPRLVSMSIITRGETRQAIPSLRQRLVELAPTSAIDIVDDASSVIAATYRRERFFAMLVAAFTSGALALAAVGLYALLATLVSRSTMEIGVRKSLGATATGVRLLMLRRGLVLAFIGLAIGLMLSLAAARALQGVLHDVAAFDLRSFAAGVVVVLIMAVLASLLPARRAAAVEPTEALRGS